MNDKNFKEKWLKCGTIISCGLNKVLIGWGKRKWYNALKPNSQSPQFYFPDFFLKNENCWFEHSQFEVVEIGKVLPLLEFDPTPAKPYAIWNKSSHHTFQQIFKDLKKKIELKEIEKAVPFIFESSPSSLSLSQLSRSLSSALLHIKTYPMFVYGFWEDRQGMLGLTPELLFAFDRSGTIETMACAGTAEAGKIGSIKALNQPKEQFEHDLVVQGIVQSLESFGKTTIGKKRHLVLPQLIHLITDIKIDVSQPPDFEKIVHTLHPTPALGGTPRQTALQWLKEYQTKINRGRFGAPAGCFLPETGEAKCYVAIRNVQWTLNEMLIGAGCGVVAKSQWKQEWEEIGLKIRATKEILAL